jgi:hypothetical protein
MAIAQSVGEPRRITARPPTRTPLSKPRRARLILSATAATVLSVLAGWLLLAPWMRRTRSESPVLAATLDDAQTQRPEAITAGMGGRVLADVLGARLVAPSALPGARDGLAGRSLVVLYLGGVGLVDNGPGARDEGRPWVIAGDAHDPAQRIALDDLIEQLDTKEAPPTLLILDLVPIASDRDLSIYGNGLLNRLEELMKSRRDGRVVVLASCAEGQESWMNEAERRSVFAHYVAEGLAGGAAGWDGTVTVHGLRDYVAPRVASWVSAHRAAVQTPVVLGNLDLLDGPPLPRIRPRTRAADSPERGAQAAMTADAQDAAGKADDLGGDVVAAWKRRDTIARQWAEREGRLRNRALAVAGSGRGDAATTSAVGTPALADPLAWRAYEAALLRAEARYRAGDEPNARIALDEAARLADEVERLIGEVPHPEALSVAMLERNLAATKAEAAEPAAYNDMVDRVLNTDRYAAPGSAPAPAAPAAAPEAPQAPADAAPKADAPAKADTPPAPAQRAAPPTIADLTTDSLHSTPLYAEGRLAVWYHRFVQRRGESEMARAERLRLLGFGNGVLRLAERVAAADPAVHRWLRARLDEADARRREGQDILFAADPADIAKAKPALDAAEVAYKDASREALACLEIHGLLRRLQDELPAYAEAVARLGDSDNEAFLGLVAAAADLADLVEDPAMPDAATLVKGCDERDLRAGLGRRLAAFESGFEARAATLAARAGPSDWRQVDALLRCPRLPAETRQQLLAKAAAPELSPSLEGGSARAAGEASADPSVLREARNLARIEAGLLRLAGADRAECGDLAAPLESGEPKVEALDRFARRASAMRRRLLDGRPGRIAEAGSSSAADQVRGDLAAADRAARVAPTADALRMRRGGDPSRLLLAYDRLDQLRWYARRLDEELASREAANVAQTVLGDHGRRWFRDLDELERLIKDRLVAQVRIEPDGSAGVRLVMDSALPAGQAALLGGPLIAIPGGSGRREVAVPADRLPADAGDVAVFFRGRVFPEAAPPPPEALRLVDVRLREVKTEGRAPITVISPSGAVRRRGSVSFEWQDQFEVHRDRIYVQKNHPLHYKLILENRRKDRPLTLYVSYGLSSRRPMTRTLTIPPGGVDESLDGKVFVDDLAADKPDAPASPDTLVVQVRRGGALGELVAEPVSVEVSRIHPRSYIDATLGYAPDAFGQVVVVTVKHHGGTMLAPAFVEVGFQPPAFHQLPVSKTLNPCNIRAGETVEFRFQVVQAPEKFKWTVTADHETVRSQEEVFGVPGAAPPDAGGEPPPGGKPTQGGAPPQGPPSAGGPG